MGVVLADCSSKVVVKQYSKECSSKKNLNSDGDGVDGECYWQVYLFFIFYFVMLVA
jgi:hypothetical protein